MRSLDADILIKGGKIIDGAGNPWFRADLAIKNGNIVGLGRSLSVEAERVINAEDLVVCPGFIDAHSHSDMSVLINPKAESMIMQGITTMVVGNCGMSLAPVNPERVGILERYLSPFIPAEVKLKIEWTTFGEYLKKLEEVGCSCNIVPLVGHGTIRIHVMGVENRAPTADELEEMKKLVAEAMEAGAVGLSSGLIYPPGLFSEKKELVELSKVVARYGGLYTSHIRGEGVTLLDAVKEAIEIGEEANVPVQISHHKASGRTSWGKSAESLKLMEEARDRGVDVTCDQYPYKAGMTSLATLLPPWAHEGGLEMLVKRLKDPEQRRRMRRDMEQGLPGWQNWILECGWENIYISFVKSEKNKALEGKNLVEAAKIMGKEDEFTALCDLLMEEEGAVSMVIFAMSEEDVRRILVHPLQMVGTDGWAVAPYGVLSVGKPHPRFYGTYPKILRKYVREEGLLTLEEAIRKMTSFPAQKFNLRDRGLLREGFRADIVVFDPERIADKATYENPHQYPEGIEYVLVNGEVVVEKGVHVGTLAGKIIRHQAPS